MKGSFRRRGCTCNKKKCTCGSTWSFRIDVGIDPKTGKRRQKEQGGFRTKAEAEAAATKLHAELMEGTYRGSKDVTFKTFAAEWLEAYTHSGDVKVSTVRLRGYQLKNLLPYFAHLKLQAITKRDYQDCLIALKKKGLADNYTTGIHATGKMLFQRALELDLIKSDPTQYAKIPRTRKTVEDLESEEDNINYLEKEELAHFLHTVKKFGLSQDYAVFITLAYTGIRVSELCALKWRDIDFAEGSLSITKTLYNPDNRAEKYLLLPPKTKTSKRVIGIDPTVLAELDRLRAQQKVVKMKHRATYHDADFIFIRKRAPGYPIASLGVRNRMERLMKLSAIGKSLTPHSLRHTHTSLMAEAGVGLQEIMERLGHKNDSTTRNVYMHVTKTMKKEASEKFSQLMKNLL